MEQEMVAMWIQTLSSVVGLTCIVGGLFSMKAAGHRRDREIDAMATAFAQQGETLGKIGQALDRQGEAMTKAFTQQGEAMTQAFTQQGEVLAELLRRTA